MDWLKENWKFILGVAGVIFVLVLMWNTASAVGDGIRKLFGIEPKDGKGSGITDADFVPIPTPGDGAHTSGLSAEDLAEARRVAIELHLDMEGLNLTRNVQLWAYFLSLSDAMTVAVYNDFNRLYFNQGKGTLTNWVKNEYAWQYLFNQGVTKQAVLSRLASLNLR